MTKKELRQAVYDKYNGHCAYCGCEITLKEMQIDHIESKWHAELKGEEVDNTIENLMPACRQCNFYKGAMGIEKFRKQLTDTLLPNITKTFQWRLAEKYHLVEKHNTKAVKFYFEKEMMQHGNS